MFNSLLPLSRTHNMNIFFHPKSETGACIQMRAGPVPCVCIWVWFVSSSVSKYFGEYVCVCVCGSADRGDC